MTQSPSARHGLTIMDGVHAMSRLILTCVTWALCLAVTPVVLAAPLQQDTPTGLRRDQEEIIRKSERLRDLMETLLERYQQQGRIHQVNLLRKGLEHLNEAGLLEDVAGIRDRLRDQALTEALRKQAEVVTDLEQLLAILRDRRSVENLEQEIKEATRLAEQADELLRRQTELQQETLDALESEPTPAEQEWLHQLAELARQQAEESRRNSRSAGLRAPFLEDALRRVESLLEDQQALEQTAERQLSGGGALPERAAAQRDQLEELARKQRELMEARSTQRSVERTAQAADEVRTALERDDTEALRLALSKLQSRLDAAADRSSGRALQAQRDRLAEVDPGDTQAAGEAAAEVGRTAAELAEKLQAQAERQHQALRESVEASRDGMQRAQQDTKTAEALERAAAALDQARELRESGREPEGAARLAEAARALQEARRQHQADHPEPRQRANGMASEANQVASSLRQTPATPDADEQGEPAEMRAAEALANAEEALRAAAEQLTPPGGDPTARSEMSRARDRLEAARDELQQALAAEGAGRGDQLAQAAARQEQLRQAAEKLAGAAPGQLSPEQAGAAAEPLEQALDAMRQAEQQLGNQQQASGSQQQARAAEALQQAAEAVEQSRPLTEEQERALEQMAEQQEQLEEDIIRLAREVEERDNQKAQEALERAAEAANRAQQAMRDGDPQETQQQQEEAREQLEQAKEALEEERDRYEDLRREELLFRMGDELKQFLERQRAITAETTEIGESLTDRRMTRRMRRKLNELGQREEELANQADFLRTSLAEEQTLVFTHVLQSNQEDLEEVSRRLGGRNPDASDLTVMLQTDVEERTEKLLAALKREQERRQQSSGSNSGEQGESTPRLVPILAELQMLKQMEEDLLGRTKQMQAVLETRGGDGITDLETTLVERLANRHHAVTRIFMELKAQLETAMQEPEAEEAEENTDEPKEQNK